jgi:hypothetical protein
LIFFFFIFLNLFLILHVMNAYVVLN